LILVFFGDDKKPKLQKPSSAVPAGSRLTLFARPKKVSKK